MRRPGWREERIAASASNGSFMERAESHSAILPSRMRMCLGAAWAISFCDE